MISVILFRFVLAPILSNLNVQHGPSGYTPYGNGMSISIACVRPLLREPCDAREEVIARCSSCFGRVILGNIAFEQ